ncbi:hypothetical protein F511_11090 [Dorcoceras hygrometricum]|uniref:Uncharacterized protein n=1 Tax=Dorcoceras hygrometricum TaxID=472368 RepID=A0A2Z7AAZ8_9LAMI|nr:hypothetical protein F511_11090 [Dorcoceras hygrometricum]
MPRPSRRMALLHLHTCIFLLSSVLLAVPVLLIEEYQDAVFKDERGRGDRPAELPLCPAWLPEAAPANGQRRPKQDKGRKTNTSLPGFSAGRGFDPAGGAQDVDRVSQLAYNINVLVLLAGECPVLVGLYYKIYSFGDNKNKTRIGLNDEVRSNQTSWNLDMLSGYSFDHIRVL